VRQATGDMTTIFSIKPSASDDANLGAYLYQNDEESYQSRKYLHNRLHGRNEQLTQYPTSTRTAAYAIYIMAVMKPVRRLHGASGRWRVETAGVGATEMITGRRCGVCPGATENEARTNMNRKWKRRNELTSNSVGGDILAHRFSYIQDPQR
jgi:hypothetical protein